jgi:glucokinase
MNRRPALAVDLGGSSLRVALAGATGPGRVVRRPVSRATTTGEVLDALADAAADALGSGSSARPGIVVVAVPTFVEDDGRLADCPNLPDLTGRPLAALVRSRLAAEEVVVVPDLAAAAVAEQRLGAGRGVARLLVVALGTGANAAAVVDGRLVETAYGCLGDAGHVLVEPDGPVCTCGGRGCLEAVTSGWALARDAAAAGLPTGPELSALAAAGHPAAAALLTRAGTALGRAISTWSVMLFPDLVTVGGGLVAAGELLLAPARAEVDRTAPSYVRDRLTIAPSALGDGATLAGAALLAAR